MADNAEVQSGTGIVVATDDIGSGVQAQKVKLLVGTDGASDPLPGDTGNGLDVDVTRLPALPAGDNNIGNVDIVTMPAVTVTGVSTLTEQQTQTAHLATIAGDTTDIEAAVELLDDTIFTDDAAFTLATSKVNVTGGYAAAHGSNPTAMTAGRAGVALMNRHHIPFTLGGHPNIISAEYITTASQTDDPVVAVVSSGTKIVVTCITVVASAANTVSPAVRIGFGTASVPTQGASGADGVAKVLLSHPGVPAGSGLVKGNGAGIVGIGGDGDDLRITCGAPTSGSLVVQVDYFTIES